MSVYIEGIVLYHFSVLQQSSQLLASYHVSCHAEFHNFLSDDIKQDNLQHKVKISSNCCKKEKYVLRIS